MNMNKLCALLSLLITTAVFAAPPRWKNVFGNLKTIAICAPGRPGKSSEVDLGIKLLQEAGYKVKIMPHARNNEGSKQMVDAKLRTADLVQAWLDPEVDAIFCVRGGSGSEEVAAMLDWEKLRSRKLPVAGFSDITSLHSAMAKNGVGHVFHGPSLTQLTKCNAVSVAWFGRAISGADQPPVKLQVIRGGNCSGYPAGGHLTLYQKARSSGNAPSSDDRIVFLECPSTRVTNHAQYLEMLRKTGCFDRCAAVVFGDLKGDKAKVDQIIRDFAAKVKCPVFRNMPYGHQSSNFLLDFDRKVTISADGVLQFENIRK